MDESKLEGTESTNNGPASQSDGHDKPAVCVFKKPAARGRGNIRKRQAGSDEEGEGNQNDGADGGAAKKSQKQARAGGLAFTTGSAKKESADAAVDVALAYASNRLVQTEHDSRATASLETETEFDKDARSLKERQLSASLKDVAEDDGQYHGLNSYRDHKQGFRRETTLQGKASGAYGPLRAQTHMRMSARFDYQPDICKDYKETGYCGYGDACKFLHDRGDYKSGWQLENEWNEKQKAKTAALRGEMAGEDEEDYRIYSSSDEDDNRLPFACLICRKRFVDPVVTRCKHYFCEKCALKNNASKGSAGKCFACKKPTGGVFNTAHELIRKMKEQEAGKAEAGEPADQPSGHAEGESD